MPTAVKKNKRKIAKKALPEKMEKKFVSESVSVAKNPRCKQNRNETTFFL